MGWYDFFLPSQKLWSCGDGCLNIYSNKKDKSDFHGTVSFDPVKMLQQNKNKMFIKRPTHKHGNYSILSSDLEELLNLMCTQLFPLSPES